MPDQVQVVLIALGCSLAIALPGALLLHHRRRWSVTVHVCVLIAVAVLSVLAGVVGTAVAMFLSTHDLTVLLIVVGVAGAVSLAVALWLGRRLAVQSVWAAVALDRERKLEASRRELVAWVSHDLRSPLAGLRAMAEALEDGVVRDRATVATYHRRIRTETDRMAGLVDDLFELSRINAGALRLSLSAVSVGDLVSDAISSAEPLAAAKGVRLVANAGGWPVVQGSLPELSRVLANLLRNAIRHTPSDGAVVVTGGRDDVSNWFAVTDTCGGIPEPDLPRVFDVAFRGQAARTPERVDSVAAGGGGLGLAIVRGLVEAHAGRVAVSNVGFGCRFLVRLP
jgi:signal transduction histidine kinase